MDLPLMGFGTWELRGEECFRTVQFALDLGYRHIDTAHIYDNHEEIAKTLKGRDRSKIFITSKLAIEEQADPKDLEGSVQKACERALRELNVDYLDLYLIHAPNRRFSLETIFGAMEKLVAEGKVNKVGVSNYTIHHLQDLLQAGHHPSANQVEFHPYLNQQELLHYCRSHGIQLISFRSFGKGKLLKEEPLFDTIGAKYNKTGAQVILRWLIQKEIPVIPKASSESRIKENFEVFDFSLSPQEMLQIEHLNKNKRYCRPDNPEYNY